MMRSVRMISLVCGIIVAGCTPSLMDRAEFLERTGQNVSIRAYDIATERLLFDRAGVVRDYVVQPAVVREAVTRLGVRHFAVWVEDDPSIELVLATFPVPVRFGQQGQDVVVAIRIRPLEPNGSRVTVLVERVNRRTDLSTMISAEDLQKELHGLIADLTMLPAGVLR